MEISILFYSLFLKIGEPNACLHDFQFFRGNLQGYFKSIGPQAFSLFPGIKYRH